jgi:hypothetical protein
MVFARRPFSYEALTEENVSQNVLLIVKMKFNSCLYNMTGGNKIMTHKKHLAEKIAELTEMILEVEREGHLFDYFYLHEELEKAIDQYTAYKTNMIRAKQ